MIQEPKTGEELERLIVEHPVRACLHMRLGLLEEINENGEDMIDAAGMALTGLCIWRCASSLRWVTW